MPARRFHVTGIVQGVGYRPFVHGLARRLGVRGWVRNASDGVWCHAEADTGTLEIFAAALAREAPPMAVVTAVEQDDVPEEGHADFTIVASQASDEGATLISPDIATCDACLHELSDPEDRRYRYPFINCTNCGPRFTVIDDIPYDRPLTTMRDFTMCEACAREYGDPADRRFHAQPDACFVCGPRLYLMGDALGLDPTWAWDPACEVVPRPHRDVTTERRRSDAIVETAARLLAGGHIVAVKGLGGFQLACDARDDAAVARLRARKRRYGKPFAVMLPSLDAVAQYCVVSSEEAHVLASPRAPIVLLRMRPDAPALAPSLAPGLRELGVMLPYTPLHHLIMHAFDGPLVMTSGNVSEEPIATDNAEALERLSTIADAFLLHDRQIRSRYDDSVVRVTSRGIDLVRRARGFAPFPLTVPFVSSIDILAVGPEQKNTVTLVSGDKAFVSQHIGDVENAATFEAFERAIADYARLFRITPALVAHDLHPEYLPTKHARGMGLPCEGVQHHHAHIVSVMAEHGVPGPVIGVALDGTGYGPDGTIWGGEVLVATWDDYERAAHLSLLPLPGGAAAIRRPARMALGALIAHGLTEHPGASRLLDRLAHAERDTVQRMIDRRLNTLMTSSAGRLFDAVASLVGVRDDVAYEGQAAVELEALADEREGGAYSFAFVEGRPGTIDATPMFAALLDDLARATPTPAISARFHRGFSAAIVDACVRVSCETGIRTVALSGGVFMNRIVLESVTAGLERAALTVLTHRQLPANDGGVSFGQAVVAWARAGRTA